MHRGTCLPRPCHAKSTFRKARGATGAARTAQACQSAHLCAHFRASTPPRRSPPSSASQRPSPSRRGRILYYPGMPPNPLDRLDDDVARLLRELCDDDPAVAEDALLGLEELLVQDGVAADVTPHIIPLLVDILDQREGVKRALSGLLLVEVVLVVTRVDRSRRGSLPRGARAAPCNARVASRDDGAARTARYALAVLDGVAVVPDEPFASEPFESLRTLVMEELSASPSVPDPVPTRQEVLRLIERHRTGEAMEPGVYDRERQLARSAAYWSMVARRLDPALALELLDAVPGEGVPECSVARARLLADLGRTGEAAKALAYLPEGHATEALVVRAASDELGREIVPILLARLTDPRLRVRRDALAIRHAALCGDGAAATRMVRALVAEWLKPAKTHGANQMLDRKEMLALVEVLPERQERQALAEQLRSAAEPELELPDGDVL